MIPDRTCFPAILPLPATGLKRKSGQAKFGLLTRLRPCDSGQCGEDAAPPPGPVPTRYALDHDQYESPLMDSPLELAIRQIAFARSYTLGLLEDVDETLWFTMPEGCSTHVGWQVAHLAMAQYGLCLFRQRGRADVDRDLLPRGFVQKYGKGSTPAPSPVDNLSPSQIRDTLERVNGQACKEMGEFSESQLREPIDMPYAVYPTKLGSLLFCSHHEMLHAGQIGLLRRLLGRHPVR